MVAIVLAGHGSHISTDTGGRVWECVDQLRAWGVADEVTAAFWKEIPAFRHVLKTLVSEQVIVVPMFTAQGYFSKQIIPSEMGLTGQLTQQSGRIIYYTRPIGEHPAIAEIVQQRVTDGLRAAAVPPAKTTLALIGHGTRRDPTSRNMTRQQVAILQAHYPNAEVLEAYLDDDPSIPSLYTRAHTQTLIAVPFFLAMGSHVTQDVPSALGIEYGQFPAQVNGFQVFYTPPIGTTDRLAYLALELARETGLALFENPTSDPWANYPQRGRERLMAEVQAQGSLRFGAVTLEPLRVMAALPNTSLAISSPAQLRQLIRENPFRPLATSEDLPLGWQVDLETPQQTAAVLETIYPTLLADWATYLDHPFATTSLASLGESQSGLFANIHQRSSAAQIEETIQTVCGKCIRHPTWHTEDTPPEALPCASACNWWLSQLQQTLELSEENP